ncbi:hypothetical protein GDO78_016196 [Eleutherodactylus coqui]|uniref:Uncharacterized protein n=1 Tax=Eleutherodactylus coqui TaxID=57060 RepID=A0A8J6EL43_ELECQ|nr:hypothetical protein GDO78_016196 [Eleutherodactylus coqui]
MRPSADSKSQLLISPLTDSSVSYQRHIVCVCTNTMETMVRILLAVNFVNEIQKNHSHANCHILEVRKAEDGGQKTPLQV